MQTYAPQHHSLDLMTALQTSLWQLMVKQKGMQFQRPQSVNEFIVMVNFGFHGDQRKEYWKLKSRPFTYGLTPVEAYCAQTVCQAFET